MAESHSVVHAVHLPQPPECWYSRTSGSLLVTLQTALSVIVTHGVPIKPESPGTRNSSSIPGTKSSTRQQEYMPAGCKVTLLGYLCQSENDVCCEDYIPCFHAEQVPLVLVMKIVLYLLLRAWEPILILSESIDQNFGFSCPTFPSATLHSAACPFPHLLKLRPLDLPLHAETCSICIQGWAAWLPQVRMSTEACLGYSLYPLPMSGSCLCLQTWKKNPPLGYGAGKLGGLHRIMRYPCLSLMSAGISGHDIKCRI
ncbi:uncharacterized protein LOC107977260 isoform X1 [Cricetulus griseus]|uniref:uncharacterized protein LOC107977260 isoform X1 n=2 Tax=Cricetulus griseus TaxID=10029 RepID=UPI0007DA9D7F|nr:uncharacterized protein LOC107977260 isoform X1 [Cricetulus griseus]